MKSTRKDSVPSIAYDWWSELNSTKYGKRRAALARMRRASTPIEVIQEPEALRLIARLPRDPERVAALAGILAFVRTDEEMPVARAVGRSSLDEDYPPALMSEGRFRRLLQTPPGNLMQSMRRLVRMTKGRANVRDLSYSVLYWSDNVKKDWIYKYYNVAANWPGEKRAAAAGTRGSETAEKPQEPSHG